jgi:hypothetical protein
MNTWMIQDTKQLAENGLSGFEFPSHEDIESLSPGDLVRLSFKSTAPGMPCDELLWIDIESISEGKFKGFLSDISHYFEEIEVDDVIEFEETNIINFSFYNDGTGTSDPYFKGCFVSRSILEDGEKARFIYWIPPEEESESGWHVLAEDGSGGYMDDPDNIFYVPLGEVVYYDNSFKQLLFLEKETAYFLDEEQIWVEVDDN